MARFNLACSANLPPTSTDFEGEAKGDPQAARGHSRDDRPDCKMVCIASVVTRQGLSRGYDVFEGNRTAVTTIEEIVTAIEKCHGWANRVWVMNRRMVSEDNPAWLRRHERPARRIRPALESLVGQLERAGRPGGCLALEAVDAGKRVSRLRASNR